MSTGKWEKKILSSIESPLEKVIKDQKLNNLIKKIKFSKMIEKTITITPREIQYVRKQFAKAVRNGERRLHTLTVSLLEQFLPGKPFGITLIVVGRCPKCKGITKTKKDFGADFNEIFKNTEEQLSQKYAPGCFNCNVQTPSIANFLKYWPLDRQNEKILWISTRVKANTNLCYKITDIVLDVTYMFKVDKIYNQYSHTLKDMYGIKIIAENRATIMNVRDEILKRQDLSCIEEKNYLGKYKKKSGFEAYKMVVFYEDQYFEIQIQTEQMYERELMEGT